MDAELAAFMCTPPYPSVYVPSEFVAAMFVVYANDCTSASCEIFTLSMHAPINEVLDDSAEHTPLHVPAAGYANASAYAPGDDCAGGDIWTGGGSCTGGGGGSCTGGGGSCTGGGGGGSCTGGGGSCTGGGGSCAGGGGGCDGFSHLQILEYLGSLVFPGLIHVVTGL